MLAAEILATEYQITTIFVTFLIISLAVRGNLVEEKVGTRENGGSGSSTNWRKREKLKGVFFLIFSLFPCLAFAAEKYLQGPKNEKEKRKKKST